MSDNMRIWDEVCNVDEKFTKPIDDGRGLTAIVPMYLIKQATEMWGPIGEGWGFEIERDDCIYNNSRERPQDALHIMTIKLWYGGAKPIKTAEPGSPFYKSCPYTYGMGCTKLFQKRGDDYVIDHDYNKSTLTDAITNALSRLGFGGSVRLKEYQGKYETDQSSGESECDNAWSKYISWRRGHHSGSPVKPCAGSKDATDETLILQGTQMLRDNSRRIAPDTILDLITS